MENRFLYKLNEIVVVNIKTRNMDRFLSNIYKLDIDIFSVKKINYKEVNIEIYKKDLSKVKKISILNEINIIKEKGSSAIKNKFKFNRIFILSLLLGLGLLIVLSNIVFSIDVIHTSSKLKKFVYEELNKNGIRKYQFKKSFSELEEIKEKILDSNKDKLEWFEIEVVGTKYIIRLEERKINNISISNTPKDIVASRDAVIKRINAISGLIVKNVNDYVRKGDTIISGSVYLNDELKGIIKAEGTVYGEVWYNVSIEYPIVDVVTNETGKRKELYSINFFSKSFHIGNAYKNSNIVKKHILQNNVIPISISKDTFYETEEINGIYSEGEALLNAKRNAHEKINNMLKTDEYIINEKLLNYRVDSNIIYMNIFYKVYANITDEKIILIEE